MSSSPLSIPSLFFSSVAKPAWGRDTLCRFHPRAYRWVFTQDGGKSDAMTVCAAKRLVLKMCFSDFCLKLCMCALKFTPFHPQCVWVGVYVRVYLSVWSQAYTLAASAIQKLSPWGIMHEKKTSLGAHQFHRLNWTMGGVCVSVRFCGAAFRCILFQGSCFNKKHHLKGVVCVWLCVRGGFVTC